MHGLEELDNSNLIALTHNKFKYSLCKVSILLSPWYYVCLW